jgi:hypothetical protein
MTTTATETYEEEAAVNAVLSDDIERALRGAESLRTALHQLRNAAEPLAAIKTFMLTFRGYDLEEPGEHIAPDFGVSDTTLKTLSGSWQEPVRRLLDAIAAADFGLEQYVEQAQADLAAVQGDTRG